MGDTAGSTAATKPNVLIIGGLGKVLDKIDRVGHLTNVFGRDRLHWTLPHQPHPYQLTCVDTPDSGQATATAGFAGSRAQRRMQRELHAG